MKLKALKIFGWCETGSGAARQPRVSTSTPGTWGRVHGIEVPRVHGVDGCDVRWLVETQPPTAPTITACLGKIIICSSEKVDATWCGSLKRAE